VSAWKDLIIETAKTAAAQGGYEPPFWVKTGSSIPPEEPDGGTGGNGGGAQGQPCSQSQACPGGYLCLADGAGDTGQCAASCDPAAPTCGAGTACDEGLKLCVPQASPAGNASGDSGGCSVSGPAKPVPWLAGVALALAVAFRRRRAPR